MHRVEGFQRLLKMDPIIRESENEILVHGYLRRNDNDISVPKEIVELIVIHSGVISLLLPWINGADKFYDFGQYYLSRNDIIYYYHHIYDVAECFKIDFI